MYLRRQSGESYLLRVREFGILFAHEELVVIVNYQSRSVLISKGPHSLTATRYINKLTQVLAGFEVAYCTKDELNSCADGVIGLPVLAGGEQCDE